MNTGKHRFKKRINPSSSFFIRRQNKISSLKEFLIFTLQILLIIFAAGCYSTQNEQENLFADLTIDPQVANVEFFWSDTDGKIFKSFKNVKSHVEKSGRKLRFAMNGGMYQEDRKPLGLFIENGKTLAPLNVRDAKGNFYLKPNGVFGIRNDNRAFLVTTENFVDDGQIKFATQSGPMLIADGEINKQFTENSGNLNLRNGVCVLEDGKMIFAVSRREVNFYDFAVYFRDAGCRNALYLDGFVSRMYLPEKDSNDLDGDFGVIIAVIE